MAYFKPNMNNINQEAKEIEENGGKNGGGKKNDYLTLEKGNNFIRILPPWSQAGLVFRKVYTHSQLPPEKEWHVCVEKTFPNLGISCPICAVLDQYSQYVDLHWSWRSSLRAYCNAIKRLSPPQDGKDYLQGILGVSETVYNWVTTQMSMPMVGDVTDPVAGIDLNIVKKDAKGKIRYEPNTMPRSCSVHVNQDIQNTILEKIVDLDSIYKEPTSEVMEKINESAQKLQNHFVYMAQNKAVLNGSSNSYNVPNSSAGNPNIMPVQTSSNQQTTQVQPQQPAQQIQNNVVKNDAPPWEQDTKQNQPNPIGGQPTGVIKPTDSATKKDCMGQYKDCSECIACPDGIECCNKSVIN